jgi:uncharacterized surface protein with fasciclin (FAS1) repeats
MRASRRTLALAAAAISLSTLVAACGDDGDDSVVTTTTAAATTTTAAEMTEAKDIVDTAVEAGSFTTLAKLLTDAGLVETLKGEGPFTVFAPTDEAFAKLPAETLEAVQNDPALLKTVLTYHVVAGKVPAADVTTGMVPTVAGIDLDIKVEGGKVMVNDATVVTPDVMASNGVIHVIDTVLVPPQG